MRIAPSTNSRAASPLGVAPGPSGDAMRTHHRVLALLSIVAFLLPILGASFAARAQYVMQCTNTQIRITTDTVFHGGFEP